MSPERPDLVLTSDIPYCEGNVLILDRLNVKSWRDVSQPS